jgi:hypothetical protein
MRRILLWIALVTLLAHTLASMVWRRTQGGLMPQWTEVLNWCAIVLLWASIPWRSPRRRGTPAANTKPRPPGADPDPE